MGLEYVRISREEKSYGYKNLLHSQLEFLSSMKRLKNYRDLRNKEFSLKVSLKSKIGEVLAEIEKLDGILPKTHFGEEHHRRKEVTSVQNVKLEDSTLMSEVNVIKDKLARLQAGM